MPPSLPHRVLAHTKVMTHIRDRPPRFVVLFSTLVITVSSMAHADDGPPSGPWPLEKAEAWARSQPWLVGCNFAPSTAINQLEMWQEDTFDLPTIERELGWAEGLGFNSVRVFLHHLLWEQNETGFLARMDQFLKAAAQHKIGVVFVLFDGVWDPFPQLGKQRAPRLGLHNSGWVQSPGARVLQDFSQHELLRAYVTGVVGYFKADRRIQAWDLFNEPDNPNRSSYGQVELPNKAELALKLLEKTFAWARSVDPTQPLTAGVWSGDWTDPEKLSPINRYMLDQSDVISFHNYRPLPELKRDVQTLRRYRRPLLCTEYMARPARPAGSILFWPISKRSISAPTTGDSSPARPTPFIPGIPGKKPMPPSPPSGFMICFEPMAHPMTTGKSPIFAR